MTKEYLHGTIFGLLLGSLIFHLCRAAGVTEYASLFMALLAVVLLYSPWAYKREG